MSIKKTYLVVVSLALCLSVGLGSCKNRGRDKSKAQQETTDTCQAEQTVTVTGFEQLDISHLNTNDFFIGEIDGKPYVLKLESASKASIHGKFYPIDSTRSSASPTPFTIHHTLTSYVLNYNDVKEHVRFSINIGSETISGLITTIGIKKGKRKLDFHRYQPPAYIEQTSTRYQEPDFSFTKTPDIQYGKAKGFWTSYPMEDDNNYTRMALKLLPKTMAPKQQNLLMDLYMPENDSIKKHPLLVLLHGGAFFFGDKGTRNMREWCEHFAKCGYVVASVNYRLGFALVKSAIMQCTYQATQDAHAALRYLVAHAEEYQIDPDYIFLAGTSAGSMATLATAFMTNENSPPFVEKYKLLKKCGSLHTSGNEYRDPVKVKAIANMWGAVYDLHELDGRYIPVISFHGTNDQIVPFDHGYPFSSLKSNIGEKMFDEMFGSKSIHEHLDSLHVRNKLYPLEGCGHAPHQEKDGTLNKHYYFIQEKMQAFFYPELKSKVKLNHRKLSPQRYSIDNKDLTDICWQAEGGIILSISDNEVRVVWLSDAPKHLLRASGLNAIGVPFKEEWDQSKHCS